MCGPEVTEEGSNREESLTCLLGQTVVPKVERLQPSHRPVDHAHDGIESLYVEVGPSEEHVLEGCKGQSVGEARELLTEESPNLDLLGDSS